MASAFEVLSKDHEEVKRMLAELEKGPTAATGADARQLARRKKMVDELIIKESRHEVVEEMYFWPAVRECHSNGDALADTALGQEQRGKEVLQQLDEASAGQPEFEELLAKFTRAARDHIRFEEGDIWPELADRLTPQDADALGQQLEQAKEIAPTRPHPETLGHPGALKGASPVIAAADRLHDAVSGRGQD